MGVSGSPGTQDGSPGLPLMERRTRKARGDHAGGIRGAPATADKEPPMGIAAAAERERTPFRRPLSTPYEPIINEL